MADNNNNTSSTENPNTVSGAQTVFSKPFPDVSKIEVFSRQNFWRWQEHVSTLLDMYEVATALTSSKPNSNIPSKQIRYADTLYLVHSLMTCLMCIVHTRKRKKFGIH